MTKNVDAVRRAMFAPEPTWSRGTWILALYVATHLDKGAIEHPTVHYAQALGVTDARTDDRLRALVNSRWLSQKARRSERRRWVMPADETIGQGANWSTLKTLFTHGNFAGLSQGGQAVAVVIAALTNHRNPNAGWCVRTKQEIADLVPPTVGKTGAVSKMHARTVQGAIRSLENAGIIEVAEQHGDKGQCENAYRILPNGKPYRPKVNPSQMPILPILMRLVMAQLDSQQAAGEDYSMPWAEYEEWEQSSQRYPHGVFPSLFDTLLKWAAQNPHEAQAIAALE